MAKYQRFEFYSDAGDLDQTRAATLLRSFGAKRVMPGVQRDMGTWWGSNQPPVVAFSLAAGIKWDSLLDSLCDQYRAASGKRVSWETRRQRRAEAPNG